MSPNEMKVLKALVEVYDSCGDFGYLGFKGIAAHSGILDLKLIRRTVRSLARKGLAKYGKGLWAENGGMAGAGYCCTKEGYGVWVDMFHSGPLRSTTGD